MLLQARRVMLSRDMGISNIDIVPTINEHIPFLWEIVNEWPEFWDKNSPIDYETFINYWKSNIIDSLTVLDNGKVVMCGCLDNVFEPVYATAIAFKRKGYATPQKIAEIAKEGVKWFFKRHNIEVLRVFIRKNHPSSIKLVQAIGFSYEGVFRHWKQINGKWIDFVCASILRSEI